MSDVSEDFTGSSISSEEDLSSSTGSSELALQVSDSDEVSVQNSDSENDSTLGSLCATDEYPKVEAPIPDGNPAPLLFQSAWFLIINCKLRAASSFNTAVRFLRIHSFSQNWMRTILKTFECATEALPICDVMKYLIVFTVKALTPSPTLSHSLSRLTYVPSLLWHRHFTHSRLALLRLQFDPYGGIFVFASHLTSFPETLHVFRCCVYNEMGLNLRITKHAHIKFGFSLTMSVFLLGGGSPGGRSVFHELYNVGLRKAMIYMNEFGNVLLIFYREIANAVDKLNVWCAFPRNSRKLVCELNLRAQRVDD
ncbi:conserved hypothetical protein [Trichinella spiralis]|uniref:hypothetical protein n=1 Tax=Trichinella spiralis TaxID=6334 RepID=UPI0001EFC396|nr:conserved hypothetical protein [Trichinella spiralis]